MSPLRSNPKRELQARLPVVQLLPQEVSRHSLPRFVAVRHETQTQAVVPAAVVLAAEEIAGHSLPAAAPGNFDVIGIDEVHMFDPKDLAIIKRWILEGKSLFISGLDLDYRGKMPAMVNGLLELKPETIIYKIAVCDFCKKYQAQFSQIVHNGEPVTSGLPLIVPEDGTYAYQARCRHCFIKPPTT